MREIMRTQAAIFKAIDKNFISIQQLSSGKRDIVKAIDLLALLQNVKSKCLTRRGTVLKYIGDKHLVSEKNDINTYLTRGYDEQLVALIQEQLRDSFAKKGGVI